MLNLKSLETDPQLAREGVWMDYMGGRFLLARKGPEYDRRLVELYNENLELIKSNSPEGNLRAIEIYQEAFAECVLLDWDKIVDDQRQPVAYTKELAVALIKNPLMGELVTELERFSINHTNYRVRVEQEVAEDVKNSADS